jgi:hypothetical protein
MTEHPVSTSIRHYGVDGQPGRTIVLSIHTPSQQPTGEFGCLVVIADDMEYTRKTVFGADGIQAFQLALDYARRELESLRLPLTWSGGEVGDLGIGDLGIPRTIDGGLGLWFQRRLEQMVEQETERMQQIAVAILEHARRARSG